MRIYLIFLPIADVEIALRISVRILQNRRQNILNN